MESEGKKENKESKKEISELEIIERDLITKFRKDIYRPFCKALDKYEILKDGSNQARLIAYQTLHEVRDAMGINYF